MKYFVFNKPLDFNRGYMENCRWENDGLTLQEDCGEGVFFSRILDSREDQTVWHRFVRTPSEALGVFVNFSFYAGDSRKILVGQQEMDVEEIIKSETISAEEKKRIFRPFLQMEEQDPEDMLLFDIKGRYMWFAAELYAGTGGLPVLKDMTVYFPKETWLRFLPSLYEKDKESADFLERYLSIFQSVYEDLETRIRQDASCLEPAVAGEEFLSWLAEWLDIGNIYMWNSQKLRELTSKAARLFEIRGTKKGLAEMVALYTGEEPFIVEEWQTREFKALGEKKMELERLYGREPNVFTLLVKEKYLSSSRDYQALERLVREAAPAYMEVRIVPLKPYIFLGDYSYLGINSGLGQYRPLALDGLSAVPFTVIGSGVEEGDRK